MRRIALLILIVAIAGGGWWLWNESAILRDTFLQYVENGELTTLEARYTPEHVMEKRRKELLPDSQHAYQDPVLKFYPHLLIEAKYTMPDKKTREGLILWGLVDGEMVLDGETWEMTHGFADAIDANASRADFKVMYALARNNGSCTREQMQKELHLDSDTLDPWIESVSQKHLVVQNGNEFQLHFQNPKILVTPQTKLKQALVSKSYQYSQCVGRKYSRVQVEKVAQAAFGPSFTIRNVSEVFLPVYGISVLNPDGSVHTTYWNAINGERHTNKF